MESAFLLVVVEGWSVKSQNGHNELYDLSDIHLAYFLHLISFLSLETSSLVEVL